MFIKAKLKYYPVVLVRVNLHFTTGPSADLSIFFNLILGNLSFLAGFVPALSFFSADDALDEWESTDNDDDDDETLKLQNIAEWNYMKGDRV